jgi:hypothetical protein
MSIDFEKNFAFIELLFTTRHYAVKFTDDAGRQIEANVERTFEENIDRPGEWMAHHVIVDGERDDGYDTADIIDFARESVAEKKV